MHVDACNALMAALSSCDIAWKLMKRLVCNACRPKQRASPHGAQLAEAAALQHKNPWNSSFAIHVGTRNAPHLMAYSWLRPHGSKRLGMSTMSASAVSLWEKGTLKPTCARAHTGAGQGGRGWGHEHDVGCGRQLVGEGHVEPDLQVHGEADGGRGGGGGG